MCCYLGCGTIKSRTYSMTPFFKAKMYEEVIMQGAWHQHVFVSVETGSGHPGHIFSGSSGSDPVYNLSGSDPDWIT